MELSNNEITYFCGQMAMILKAGISSMEGVSMLAEDADSEEGRTILKGICSVLEEGGSLHLALERAQVFPKYLLDMTEIGEQSGRLDEVMEALAAYYEREEAISKSIKNAVTYPLIMIGMMVAVILVLIIKVMPIFEQVYIQLGSEMSGFGGSMLALGGVLSRYSIAFLLLLAILTGCALYFTKSKKGRASLKAFASGFVLTRSLYDKIAASRFAGGMALCLSSGLDMDESLEMVSRLVDNDRLHAKITGCQEKIASGMGFSEAMGQSGLFTGVYAGMVSVGVKTGATDEVMKKIALQYEDAADQSIQKSLSVIEPTLVAVLSVIVGLILLSVMLPLMGIMSAIG